MSVKSKNSKMSGASSQTQHRTLYYFTYYVHTFLN